MSGAKPTPDEALTRLTDLLMDAQASVRDGCGYCFDEDDLEALSGPVDQIPEWLLSKVAAKHPSHWDDFANLYRRLTPRIMSLLVYGDLHIDVQLIAHRFFVSGCWYLWADDEREAMLSVCEAWWDDTLRSYPRQPWVYEVLSFLVTTPVPLTTWLATWDAQPPGPADLHARDLCGWWLPDLLSGDLTVGWAEQTDITTEITHWISESAGPRLARVSLDPVLTVQLRMFEEGR